MRVSLILLFVFLGGCPAPFTLTTINTGVSGGRTFERAFDQGKATWCVNINGQWTRDKK